MNQKKFLLLIQQNRHLIMNVFTGKQAEDMILKDKYPDNSIGVCRTKYGWAYWYFDGHTFDSGVEDSEELALARAKMNVR
jgi:hypothetical protein